MPSSLHISSTAMPHRSPRRCWSAIAHGACTWAPNGRQHAHPPVADLVAEALDDDRAVVGHGAGGLGLLVEVGDEVGGGALVEPAVAQALHRIDALARLPPAARG